MGPNEAQLLADRLTATSDLNEAFRSGIELLRADFPELVVRPAKRLFERHKADARMAQLLGLAARAAGDGPLAYTAFARAARQAPGDGLIAHSHARTALEAGIPAVELFDRAARLAPQDGSVLLGFAAALVAERRGQEAIDLLSRTVAANPTWLEGHRALAHVRGQLGRDPLAEIDSALSTSPTLPALHRLRIATLLEARRYSDAADAVSRATASIGETGWLLKLNAHIASELGDIARADEAFAAAPPPETPEEFALSARHLLRAGRAREAADLLEARREEDNAGIFWPYLSLAWRLLDDPRYDWLEGDRTLVGIYDLKDRIGDLGVLAEHLRGLHVATCDPLDQSVRGGTQTDGNLLLRDEAPVRNLRAALVEAVARHVEGMSPPVHGHPTLVERRQPQRIAGSWSVRLNGAGFHADHVHSHGWLSSAFYVALPETIAPGDSHSSESSAKEGWLALGASYDVLPDLAPTRFVEPKPGRLVLFPSTMWHGTRPFPSGERLTVAFDIARPKQK